MTEEQLDSLIRDELHSALTEGDIKPLATFYAYTDEDIQRYSHCKEYQRLVWDYEETLRNAEKYQMDQFKDAYSLWEKLNTEFCELKNLYHIPEGV